MPMEQRFEEGDLVLKKGWKSPKKVTDVSDRWFYIGGDSWYYNKCNDEDWTNMSTIREPTGMSRCKFIVIQDNGRLNEGKQFDKHEEAVEHASAQTQRLRKNHMVFSLTNIVKVKETPVIVETISCG